MRKGECELLRAIIQQLEYLHWAIARTGVDHEEQASYRASLETAKNDAEEL